MTTKDYNNKSSNKRHREYDMSQTKNQYTKMISIPNGLRFLLCRLNNFCYRNELGLYSKWKTMIELELRWTSCPICWSLVLWSLLVFRLLFFFWNETEPSKLSAYAWCIYVLIDEWISQPNVRLQITLCKNTQDDRLTHSKLIVNLLNVIHTHTSIV